MECREFQFTIVSAQNVENVREIFKNRLRVYPKVSLGGNPRTQKTTLPDKEGPTNPVWNFSSSFTVGKNAVTSEDVKFLIQLYSGKTSGDKYMGEVSVSLKELFDRFSSQPQGEDTAKVSYPVKKEDAYSQGEVCFTYKFGDIFPYQPPPNDWGNVCSQGTKLILKGDVLYLRLTSLANGNIFDLPIDAAADVAYTTYDILSQVFGSGADLLADIPCGTEIDLPVDIPCLGANVPMALATTTSLQTDFEALNDSSCSEGDGGQGDILGLLSNVYVPIVNANAGDQTVINATSVAESNLPSDSTNMYAESNMCTGSAGAGTNLVADVLYVPSYRTETRTDNASCVETNESEVPTGIDAFSCVETNMPANVPVGLDDPSDRALVNATTFRRETKAMKDLPDATFSDETSASTDVSCQDAAVGVDISKDSSNINGETRDDTGVADTFSANTLSDDISSFEIDDWENAWNHATFNGEVCDTYDDETSIINQDTGFEGDADFNDEPTVDNAGTDDTFNNELDPTQDFLDCYDNALNSKIYVTG